MSSSTVDRVQQTLRRAAERLNIPGTNPEIESLREKREELQARHDKLTREYRIARYGDTPAARDEANELAAKMNAVQREISQLGQQIYQGTQAFREEQSQALLRDPAYRTLVAEALAAWEAHLAPWLALDDACEAPRQAAVTVPHLPHSVAVQVSEYRHYRAEMRRLGVIK